MQISCTCTCEKLVTIFNSQSEKAYPFPCVAPHVLHFVPSVSSLFFPNFINTLLTKESDLFQHLSP